MRDTKSFTACRTRQSTQTNGQSVLVILGGLGGMTGWFSVAAVGILAGLVVVTPVGLLTVIPSLLPYYPPNNGIKPTSAMSAHMMVKKEDLDML